MIAILTIVITLLPFITVILFYEFGQSTKLHNTLFKKGKFVQIDEEYSHEEDTKELSDINNKEVSIMKKICYYVICIFAFIAIWFVLGVLLYTEVFGFRFVGFTYGFGQAMGHPELLLIGIGAVLLLRRYLYELVTNRRKDFGKAIGIWLITIGSLWLFITIGTHIMVSNIQIPPMK